VLVDVLSCQPSCVRNTRTALCLQDPRVLQWVNQAVPHPPENGVIDQVSPGSCLYG
jgi:hypothetical protein